MFDEHLRGVKDRIFEGVARDVGPFAHPILLTGVALGAGLLAAWLAYQQQYAAALFLWLLNRALDALDGTMARVHGQQSDLGGYLDILGDFIVYAAIPVALVLGSPSPMAYGAVAILLALYYVNSASWLYLSALLEKRRQGASERGEATTVTMPAGLIGGTETFLFYVLFIVFPGWLVPLFLLMAALLGVTVVQRVVWAVRRLGV